MNIREHIDKLFSDYKDSAEINDFKEELAGNLADRIEALCKKGMTKESALKKALEELGDITAIAEELSLKKKQAVYSEAYMGTRNYLTPRRTAVFIAGGLLIAFGLIAAAITWYATQRYMAAISAGAIFISLGTGILTYMGVTQETAIYYPVSNKRGILYGISAAVFLFGIFTMPIVYFAVSDVDPSQIFREGWQFSLNELGMMTAFSVMIPFLLPSAALFIFLCLTEKDRNKPWVKALRQRHERDIFADGQAAERYGLFSGALWVAAISVFVLLIILIGIKFAWLSLAAAVVCQLFLTAKFMNKNK